MWRVCGILLLGLAPFPTLAQTYMATFVEAVDGQVKCNWARDRLITLISGPCDDFTPPSKVRIGETFMANGKTKTINVIVADRVEEDFPQMQLKAGDWICTAAESPKDIPSLSGKSDHTGIWLYIPKCRPVE